MEKSVLWIIGAGGHGRAVAEAAQLCGWQQIRFIDDLAGTAGAAEVDGWPVDGPTQNLPEFIDDKAKCVVAIGNQTVRARLVADVQRIGAQLQTVVHPAAWVSARASIGSGSVVMAGAVVGAHARLGKACIVNANATVDHDCVLGDFAHLGVGVQLAGGVVVEPGAWLQAGCSAGYRVIVPANIDVGPGTALSEHDNK